MTYRSDAAATKQTAGGPLGAAAPWQPRAGREGSSTSPWAWINHVWALATQRDRGSPLVLSHFCIMFPRAGASSPSPTAQNQLPLSAPQVYICHSTRLLQSPHRQWAAQCSSCPMSAGLAQDERQSCHVDTDFEVYNRKNPQLNTSEPQSFQIQKANSLSKSLNDLNKLRVSKHVKWWNLPKVCFYTYFKAVKRGLDRTDKAEFPPVTFLRCHLCYRWDKVWRSALSACLLWEKQKRWQKAEILKRFSFPTSSEGVPTKYLLAAYKESNSKATQQQLCALQALLSQNTMVLCQACWASKQTTTKHHYNIGGSEHWV